MLQCFCSFKNHLPDLVLIAAFLWEATVTCIRLLPVAVMDLLLPPKHWFCAGRQQLCRARVYQWISHCISSACLLPECAVALGLHHAE